MRMFFRRLPPQVWVAGVIAMLLAQGCSAPGAAAPQASTQRTAVITKGTLTATVNATGNIQPEANIKINFSQPGRVAEVLVKDGDSVKKGDVLARLDATDQELALAQARTALASATAAYSRTVEGPRQADIDAARAAVTATVASYYKVLSGAQPEDYADAIAALRNAEAVLKQAQAAYDQAKRANPAGINGSPAALGLEQATNGYTAVRARYDKAAKAPDNSQISAAQQQVEIARSNLDKLMQPTKTYDIEQVQAQMKQAQIQIDQAQHNIARADLTAARDGVIATVNLKVGELVAAQQSVAAVLLVDLSKLHIKITVDEIDIARIKPGQEVIVTLDAISDTELKGHIDRIAPTSATVSGVVTYEVIVLLDKTAEGIVLKAGMTANTSIVMDRRENVILAPNWAVRRDKKTGKSFITIKVDDKTSKEVEVTVGLRNETVSEILSGVAEGQVILAPQTSSLMSQ